MIDWNHFLISYNNQLIVPPCLVECVSLVFVVILMIFFVILKHLMMVELSISSTSWEMILCQGDFFSLWGPGSKWIQFRIAELPLCWKTRLFSKKMFQILASIPKHCFQKVFPLPPTSWRNSNSFFSMIEISSSTDC